MTTPIVYYHPDTGEIRAYAFTHAMPLPDCTVGVVAPALVRCQIHRAYEPLGRIMKAPTIQGHARLLSFARALLAAVCGDCRTFSRRVRGLTEQAYHTRLDATPQAEQPLASYRLLSDLLETPQPRAIATLAAMPLPAVAPGISAIRRHAVLDPQRGRILIAPPRAKHPTLVALPQDGQSLVAPCATHGWDCLGTLAPDDAPVGSPLFRNLGLVLLAPACTSCDDFKAREALLRIPDYLRSRGSASPLAFLQYCRAVAIAIMRVTQDTGWVVREELSRLADTFETLQSLT